MEGVDQKRGDKESRLPEASRQITHETDSLQAGINNQVNGVKPRHSDNKSLQYFSFNSCVLELRGDSFCIVKTT